MTDRGGQQMRAARRRRRRCALCRGSDSSCPPSSSRCCCVNCLKAGEIHALADRGNDQVGRAGHVQCLRRSWFPCLPSRSRPRAGRLHGPSRRPPPPTGVTPPMISMPSCWACSTSCLLAAILSMVARDTSTTSAPSRAEMEATSVPCGQRSRLPDGRPWCRTW